MSTSSSSSSSSSSFALAQLGMPQLVLKREQQQAISSVLEGSDVFVCLPTGFGKSICYQSLPFAFDHKFGVVAGGHAVLVVSPLIALMVDQVRSLRSRSVEAVIASSGSRDNIDKAFLATDSTLRSARLVFCSPEILVHSRWRDALENPDVSGRFCAIVIDEAHCISKW